MDCKQQEEERSSRYDSLKRTTVSSPVLIEEDQSMLPSYCAHTILHPAEECGGGTGMKKQGAIVSAGYDEKRAKTGGSGPAETARQHIVFY
jgi:hypothetical protein